MEKVGNAGENGIRDGVQMWEKKVGERRYSTWEEGERRDKKNASIKTYLPISEFDSF